MTPVHFFLGQGGVQSLRLQLCFSLRCLENQRQVRFIATLFSLKQAKQTARIHSGAAALSRK